MRFGLTEMLLVGVVIMLIIGISRFFPTRAPEPQTRPVRTLTPAEAHDEEILRRRRQSKGKLIPVFLVLIGIAVVLSAPSLLKYFFMSYIGGALIIVIGLASLFLMSRRS